MGSVSGFPLQIDAEKAKAAQEALERKPLKIEAEKAQATQEELERKIRFVSSRFR